VAGSEDHEAAIGLDPLAEIVDFHVGVSVMAVLLWRRFPNRVGLVEQEDGTALLRRVEQAAEPLLGLVEVFAANGPQIDPVQIYAERARSGPPSARRPRSAPSSSREHRHGALAVIGARTGGGPRSQPHPATPDSLPGEAGGSSPSRWPSRSAT
jgi:hypothetical protein